MEDFPQEIIDCLSRYRAKQTDIDSKTLIEFYNPFILKWIRFLRNSFDSSETPFLSFLKMFKFPGDPYSKHELIRRSLRVYESEDINSEVQLAFLEACSKSEYPLHSFVYTLSRRVRNLIHDPLVFGSYCKLENDLEYKKEEDYSLVNINGNTMQLDSDWVEGVSVNKKIFSNLSNKDRELLLRKYIGEQTASEIAADMGYASEQVVWNAISRAVARVKKQANDSKE